MRVGKLSPDELRSVVFDSVRHLRQEVVVPAALGEDSAVLDLAGELCVISTDPITGATAQLGRLAVIIACNDVATSGAEPVGVMLTILAPPHSTLDELALVMTQAGQAAEELNVQIIGGHTEVTPAVNQIVVSTTAIGRVPHTRLLSSGSATVGCHLLLVREAGLEGTALIALDHPEMLQDIFSPDEIEAAQGMACHLSVVEACRVASANGAMAMHDVTEGGVLGAAYEMAQAAGLGLSLKENIPVHLLTARICQHFSLDPLRLISSGALLVASNEPQVTVEALGDAGIPAAIIGVFTGEHTEVTMGNRVIAAPQSDELWRFKASLAD